jgi:hypothetical protein
MGVSENSDGASQQIGAVALPVAVAEIFWTLVTCGLKREALTPAISALPSVAVLGSIALS